MKVQVQKPLFAWDCLEDFPALATIRDLSRGHPRRHAPPRIENGPGPRAERLPGAKPLGRGGLDRCLAAHGIRGLPGRVATQSGTGQVDRHRIKRGHPQGMEWFALPGCAGRRRHRPELQAVFNRMVQRLGEVVSDLGKHTAGDATSLNARRLRCDVRKEREAAEARAKEQAEAGGSAPVAQASSDGTRSAEKPVAFARLVRKDRTKAAQGENTIPRRRGRFGGVRPWNGGAGGKGGKGGIE